MIVVEFAPRIVVLPPRRTVLDLIQLVILDKLRAGRNRIFDQQVPPLPSIQRQARHQHVTYRHRAFERLQLVHNLVPIFDWDQLEVIAR